MGIRHYFWLGTFAVIFGGCMFDDHGHEEDHDHGNHSETSLSITADSVNPAPVTKAELMVRGQTIYNQLCSQCHQANGQGVPASVPPLANSDYLMADRKRSIDVLLEGRMGEITVNGVVYDGNMPAIIGSDNDIAAVLTYVRNQFNGATDSIAVEEVTQARGHEEH